MRLARQVNNLAGKVTRNFAAALEEKRQGLSSVMSSESVLALCETWFEMHSR